MREKINVDGEKGKIPHYQNIKVITDHKFKEFLGLEKGNYLLKKYEEFQYLRDELYSNKRKNDMLNLIRLWEETLPLFYFLGRKV